MCYIADLVRQVKGTQNSSLCLVADFLLFSLDLPHPAYFQRTMQATSDSARTLANFKFATWDCKEVKRVFRAIIKALLAGRAIKKISWKFEILFR